MWPYWMMFLVPALAAYNEKAALPAPDMRLSRVPLSWWLVAAALTLLVGWRHEVGGDWFNYQSNFDRTTFNNQDDFWTLDDPGYRTLEWLAIKAGWGIHAVNLMGATIFSGSLIWFCRSLPRPWLALTVAVPYVVIVLGMGYTRQGLALGCSMVGLAALGHGRVRTFVLWILLGATFHKSAVLLLPIAALAASRNRMVTAAWVAMVAMVAYALLLVDSVETLKTNYLEAQYQSEGALVRLLMNVVPALILLSQQSSFSQKMSVKRLWFWIAVIALVLMGLFFMSPSSTAIDRLALYILPLQLMVFSILPEALGRSNAANRGWVMCTLLYYAIVHFVWLNYAENSKYWVPYKFYPLEEAFWTP